MPFDGTYDPGQVDVIFAGPIVGFSEGSMVKASRSEDGFTAKVGADGRVARSRNRNKSGTVTITLAGNSPSNDKLQALAILDEDTGQGTQELFIKDRTSKSGFVHAAAAWVQKIADLERAKEIGDVEWTIFCAELEISNSGLATAVGP